MTLCAETTLKTLSTKFVAHLGLKRFKGHAVCPLNGSEGRKFPRGCEKKLVNSLSKRRNRMSFFRQVTLRHFYFPQEHEKCFPHENLKWHRDIFTSLNMKNCRSSQLRFDSKHKLINNQVYCWNKLTSNLPTP